MKKNFLALILVIGMLLGGTPVLAKEMVYADDTFVGYSKDNLPQGWTISETDTNTTIDVAKQKALVLKNAASGDSSIATCNFGVGNGTPVILELDFSYRSGSAFTIRYLQDSKWTAALAVQNNVLTYQTSSGNKTVATLTPDTVHTLKLEIQSFGKTIDVYVDGTLKLSGEKAVGGGYAPGTMTVINTGSSSVVSLYRFSKRADAYNAYLNETFYNGMSEKWSYTTDQTGTVEVEEIGKFSALAVQNGTQEGTIMAIREFGPINGRPIETQIKFSYEPGAKAGIRLMQDKSAGWITALTVAENKMTLQKLSDTEGYEFVDFPVSLQPNREYVLKIKMTTIAGSDVTPGYLNIYLDDVLFAENVRFLNRSACGYGYMHIICEEPQSAFYVHQFDVVSNYATAVTGFQAIHDVFETEIPQGWWVENSSDGTVEVVTSSTEKEGLSMRNTVPAAETITATKTFTNLPMDPQTIDIQFSSAGNGTKIIRILSENGSWMANFKITGSTMYYSTTASTEEIIKQDLEAYHAYNFQIALNNGTISANLDGEPILSERSYTSGGAAQNMKSINFFVINGYSDFNIKSVQVKGAEKPVLATVSELKFIDPSTGEDWAGESVFGKEIQGYAQIKNETGKEQTAILIMAVYKGNQLLQIITDKNESITEEGTTLQCQEMIDATADKVQLFVLNSLQNLTPISQVIVP